MKFVRALGPNALLDLMTVFQDGHEDPRRFSNTQARYEDEIEDQNRRVYLVYDDVGVPLAYVHLVLNGADANPALANGWDIAHIHDLRVRKSRHREGVAKFLMISLEAEAKKSGIDQLTLGVDAPNLIAFKMYSAMNYAEFDRVPGRTPDEELIYMRKKLSQSFT